MLARPVLVFMHLCVQYLLYMCCLSPCAQPFSPVVMTLVSELEARGSNLSI